MSDYNIQKESTLRMEERLLGGYSSHEIIVRMESGKTITLKAVFPDDLIEVVKSKIQNEEGILPDQQCLIFGSRELENSRTVRHYNILYKSTVDLILRT